MKNNLAGMVVMWVGLLFAADYTRDSPEAIRNKVRAGKAVLLDVREKAEWDASHIDGAKWLPLSQITKGATRKDIEAVIGSDKPVYIHCKAGIRCMKAAEILEKQGIKAEAINDSYDNLKQAFLKK